MVFPFSVRFNRRLKATITLDNQHNILYFIVQSISGYKADNVVAGDTDVAYKGSTSNRRGSLFGRVDDGVFTLVYKDNSWWLNYQINMCKLFIYSSIFLIIMSVFSLSGGGPWWLGIPGFLWVYGVNWIINSLRHGMVATNIAQGIDDLICGKVVQSEQEDIMTGELKSWF